MNRTISPKRHMLLAALAAVLAATSARAEESNRNVVRANLEQGGWSVVWGKNFTEADWVRGLRAIAQSVAEENPGPFLEWFGQTLDENFSKIERNLRSVSRRDLERWILQSLKQKQIINYKGFLIEAGFATYDRWERVVYDEPRSRMEMRREPITGIESEVPVFYTERVERRTNLPNWHQFYIRYRLVGHQPDQSGGGQEHEVNRPSQGGQRPQDRPSLKAQTDAGARQIEQITRRFIREFSPIAGQVPEGEAVLRDAHVLADAAVRVTEARTKEQAEEYVLEVGRAWHDLHGRLERASGGQWGPRSRPLLQISGIIRELRSRF